MHCCNEAIFLHEILLGIPLPPLLLSAFSARPKSIAAPGLDASYWIEPAYPANKLNWGLPRQPRTHGGELFPMPAHFSLCAMESARPIKRLTRIDALTQKAMGRFPWGAVKL